MTNLVSATGILGNFMDWYNLAITNLGYVEVTKWSRLDNGYEHNHIEMGHAIADKPVGHPSWANGKWSKLFCYAAVGTKPLKILTY